MASQIDFAIAVGLFFVFIVVLINYLTNYLTSFSSAATSSEIRSATYSINRILFGSKGVPSDWEDRNTTPVKIGLVTDLYRVPVVVNETNGTVRTNVSINVTISFDSSCQKKAWNNTVRVYENSTELPHQLYNQTFCSSKFLNQSDVVFNVSLNANQKKVLWIFYSDDKNVSAPNYTVPFSSPENLTISIYPADKTSVLSISKLNVFRNLSSSEVSKTLGVNYKVNVEVSG